jgi:hypothetical protein
LQEEETQAEEVLCEETSSISIMTVSFNLLIFLFYLAAAGQQAGTRDHSASYHRIAG